MHDLHNELACPGPERELSQARAGIWPKAIAAACRGTSKGQLTLLKELLPGGRLELHAERATSEISRFVSLLAGRTSKTASLEELMVAAAAGGGGFIRSAAPSAAARSRL